MSVITEIKNGILFQVRDEIVCIEAYGESCIRVRSTRNSKLSDEKWTLLEAEKCSPKAVVSDGKGVVENGILRAEITDLWGNYQLSFYKRDKLILRTHNEGDYVTKYEHTEGQNYRTRIIFDSQDEHIYGIGQEQQDFFDKKGCSYDLKHWNTKSALPVVYSSLGYGFLWNNPAVGRVEFALNHTIWSADSCYQADYLVFAGDTPAEVMNRYCRLTGFSPEMPEWAAGFWQCKLRYESQEDLLEIAREYKKRGIPIDAIVIDYFHWTEQGNWEFEPSLWPDPKAMCDELREMGIKSVVSIWPTINPNSKNWQRMNDENMLVRTENGQYGIFDFYGQQTYVDVTNPRAREYMWEQVKKGYYDYGIKTFWLDEAEPEVHPQQFSHLKFHIGNGSQTALAYPYYYAKTFYDSLKAEGEKDVVILTRCAYPGSQNFGAIVWNGDIASTFDSLRQSIVSGLSMAMCGIPWWNSDIGGFHSGDIESDYFRELIVRWFQFGLFCPVMRLHGVRIRQSDYVYHHEGVKEPSGGDNEIWSFGEKNYPVLKNLIELRERLKPYIVESARLTAETGEPIMRPMFFDFPDDEKCYTISDQYMFGRDILFAPIYNQGQTERSVYLPEGEWVRVSDKAVLAGGQEIICHVEIDEFIAFVKKGAKVIEIF